MFLWWSVYICTLKSLLTFYAIVVSSPDPLCVGGVWGRDYLNWNCSYIVSSGVTLIWSHQRKCSMDNLRTCTTNLLLPASSYDQWVWRITFLAHQMVMNPTQPPLLETDTAPAMRSLANSCWFSMEQSMVSVKNWQRISLTDSATMVTRTSHCSPGC